MSQPLWRPSPDMIEHSNLTAFMRFVRHEYGAHFSDTEDLHAFSVRAPEVFWPALWDFLGFIGEKGAPPYLVDGDKMPGAGFFPNARLNYAENLLRRSDDGTALVFRAEDKIEAPDELGGPQCSGFAASTVAARAGRGRGRPGRGHHAQRAGDDHRAARKRLHRRGVFFVPRRISASRASWTASARSSRRC